MGWSAERWEFMKKIEITGDRETGSLQPRQAKHQILWTALRHLNGSAANWSGNDVVPAKSKGRISVFVALPMMTQRLPLTSRRVVKGAYSSLADRSIAPTPTS
jgi:hypothetical protein